MSLDNNQGSEPPPLDNRVIFNGGEQVVFSDGSRVVFS